MPWIAKTDGVDSRYQLAWNINPAYNASFEIKFRVLGLTGTFIPIVTLYTGTYTANLLTVSNDGDTVSLSQGGGLPAVWSGVFGSALSVGQDITLRIETTGTNAKRLYVDGVDKGLQNTSTGYIGYYRHFGVSDSTYAHIGIYYATFTDSDTPSNSVDLQSDASSHGTGNPVITDVANGNNATGYNLPTDGSAWEDLGGGGTVYSLTVQSSLQSQLSQNSTLSTASVLAASSSSQIQVSSVSGLLSKSVLFLNDSTQSQTSANVANSAGALLAASNSYQAQISQDAQLAANSFITPQLSSQAQQSDSSQLFVAGVLSVQNTTNGQYSQNVTLQIDVPQITVHKSGQLSLSTSTTLLTRSMLSVSDSIQTQLSTNVFFAGDIYYLDAKILMYTDLNANLSMYHAVTATITSISVDLTATMRIN